MDLVTLKGGLTVPSEAVRLAVGLCNRGYDLVVEGEVLRLIPAGTSQDPLTDDDRTAIRRWKLHLMALATYQAEP